MKEIRLTPTAYIVLGLIEASGQATPYELKGMVAAGVGNLWSLQHAQLYSEPERLTKAGFLSETRETKGRRRKRYALTARGRAALRDWLAEPTSEFTQLRDLGLLKLFLGADPPAIAPAQLELHRSKLAEYEGVRDVLAAGGGPPGPRLTLESGIGHEREWIRFWKKLAAGR